MDEPQSTIDITRLICDAAVAKNGDVLIELFNANTALLDPINEVIEGLFGDKNYDAIICLQENIKKSNLTQKDILCEAISREFEGAICSAAKKRVSEELVTSYHLGRHKEAAKAILTLIKENQIDAAKFVSCLEKSFEKLYESCYESIFSPIRQMIKDEDIERLAPYFSEDFAKIMVVIKELAEENNHKAIAWVKSLPSKIMNMEQYKDILEVNQESLCVAAISGNDQKISDMLSIYKMDKSEVILAKC